MKCFTTPEAVQAEIESTFNASTGDDATTKGIHLSRYGSIENAKQVLAQDKRSKIEAARAFKLRENALHHQQTLAAEQQACEQLRKSKESMDEHATRLMEEMKTSVIKRFETDLLATARANVTHEFETTTRAVLKKAMRNEVYEELCSELQPVIEAELAAKLCQSIKKKLEKELKPLIEAEIRGQMESKNDLKDASGDSDTIQIDHEAERLQSGEGFEQTAHSPDVANNGYTAENFKTKEDVKQGHDAAETAQSIFEVEHDNDAIAPEQMIEAPNSANDGADCTRETFLKRSLDDDYVRSPNKRSRSEDDYEFGQGGSEVEQPCQLASVAHYEGPESPITTPTHEKLAAQDDEDYDSGFSGDDVDYDSGFSGDDENEDTDRGMRLYDDEDGEQYDEGVEEYDEEEEEYDDEEGEAEDGEDDSDGAAQKSVIAVSNTQDTAFVIDDSDEEDADETLVVETEAARFIHTKSFLEDSDDEEVEEHQQQQQQYQEEAEV